MFVLKWLCFATSPVSYEPGGHQRISSNKTALRNLLGKLAYHSVEIRQHIVQHSLRYSDTHFSLRSHRHIQVWAVKSTNSGNPQELVSMLLSPATEVQGSDFGIPWGKKSAIQTKCDFSSGSRAGAWRRSRIWQQSSTRRFAEGN